MTKRIESRIRALEAAGNRSHPRRFVWPSIEAAEAGGATGGILIIGDTLPIDEWIPLAQRQQAELISGGAHGLH